MLRLIFMAMMIRGIPLHEVFYLIDFEQKKIREEKQKAEEEAKARALSAANPYPYDGPWKRDRMASCLEHPCSAEFRTRERTRWARSRGAPQKKKSGPSLVPSADCGPSTREGQSHAGEWRYWPDTRAAGMPESP